jgi:hypothetical protein
MAQRVRDTSNSSARHGQLVLAKNTTSVTTGSEHQSASSLVGARISKNVNNVLTFSQLEGFN